MPDYDKLLKQWRGVARNSGSPFNLREALEQAIEAVDTLVLERAIRQAQPVIEEALSRDEIASKLDQIIEHLNYGSVRAR